MNDSDEGPDLLGFSADAAAFAHVIYAPGERGPMTIGLFGPWGSGKTFFMRRLRYAVEEQEQRAARLGRGVLQATFNAWHHGQSDLHASLVSRIFGAFPDDRLLSQLETVRGTRAQIEADLAAVERELSRLVAEDRPADADDGDRPSISTDRLIEERFGISPTPPRLAEVLFSGVPLAAVLVSAVVAVFVLVAAISGVLGTLTVSVRTAIVAVGVAAVLTLAAQTVLADNVRRRRRAVLVGRRREAEDLQREWGADRADRKRQADRRRDEIRARIAALQEQQQQLQQLVAATPSAVRLTEYLEHLTADSEHGGRLGMLALVRRDFAALSDLLSHPAPDPDTPVPHRLVVYIDDLDRCPAPRVVATLEAIHLMLSFPAFVVVVAVDMRWLSAALQTQFPQLVPGAPAGAATSLDYLEKIFQVPYWVRRLDDADARRLVAAWIVEPDAAPGPTGDQPEATGPRVGVPPPLAAGAEAALLTEVAPLLGRSPRAVRRFATVYRFLRATAMSGAGGWSRTDCAMSVLLLALVHGLPTIAPALCQHLTAAAPDTPVAALFTSLDAASGVRDTPEWRRVRGLVDRFVEDHRPDGWDVGRVQHWAARCRQFSFVGVAAD